ncbi:hypothetical protein GCM10010412_003970 [Nonomuraea recticatena]|uniref:Uncharacterized protein n=1 Tax=Nonomuraea recticatena TaxID=46178 RepID=A0ABN3R4J8_9ACTN
MSQTAGLSRLGWWRHTDAGPQAPAGLPAGEAAMIGMTGRRGLSNAKVERKLGRQPRHLSWLQGFKEEPA